MAKYMFIFGLFMITACGLDPRNTVTLQLAGSNTELELVTTVCEVTDLFSEAASPVRCSGRFRNTNGLTDILSFEMYDSQFIYDNLGTDLFVQQNIVFAQATIGNRPLAIVDGVMNFSRYTNVEGGEICFTFNLVISTPGALVGSFCENISIGSRRL